MFLSLSVTCPVTGSSAPRHEFPKVREQRMEELGANLGGLLLKKTVLPFVPGEETEVGG